MEEGGKGEEREKINGGRELRRNGERGGRKRGSEGWGEGVERERE